MLKKPIRLAQPSSPVLEELQSVDIPRHLPPTVKDVAESLSIRDPESAQRYLEAHMSQKGGMKKMIPTPIPSDIIEEIMGENNEA